jgi:hypothetical protein
MNHINTGTITRLLCLTLVAALALGLFPTGLNAVPVPAAVIPGVIPNATATSASFDTLKLSWSAAANASAYGISRRLSSGGSASHIATVTATTYTDTRLTCGTRYTYTITAVSVDGGLSPSATTITGTPIPAAPALKVKSATATSIKLSWKKVAGATKYVIYQQKGKTWKKIKTTKATSYNKKKLKTSKNYSFKVKAYRNKVASNYSVLIKKVKVKGDYSQPSIYGAKLTNAKLKKVRDKVANFVNTHQTWRLKNNEARTIEALNYLGGSVTYADWREGPYYNTAYGALVQHKGACSAYTRGMKALCDGMGVPAKCVHTNVTYTDHQWNHVKFAGSWWIVDAQVNWILAKVKPSDSSSDEVYRNYYIMKK